MDSGISRNDLSARQPVLRERGLRYTPRRIDGIQTARPNRQDVAIKKETAPRVTQDIIPALPRQQKAKVLARTHKRPAVKKRDSSIADISDVSPQVSAVIREAVPPRPLKPALPRQRKSQVLARRISVKAAYYQKQAAQSRRRLRVAFVGGGIASVLILTMGLLIFNQFNEPKNIQATAPATLGATTINGGIDEAPISTDAVMNHTAQAGEPVRISIPRIGVISRIFAVMADQTGEPAPTENIYDIGWLKTSSKVGEGVMVLNGYLNGPTKSGSLEQIRVLAAGDVLQIERGDGQQIKYVITKSQSYAADAIDVPTFVAAADSTKPSLVMVTNQGRFSIRENRFESRTVVWAVSQQ